MQLRDYLHLHRITCADLARKIDVHPQYLNNVKLYKLRPGKHLAIIIEAATAGKVTAEELLDENYTKNYKKMK